MYVFSESSARDAIVFQLFSFFVWMSENNSNTLYIYMCVGAYFSENEGKKYPFSKYPDTCDRGLTECLLMLRNQRDFFQYPSSRRG